MIVHDYSHLHADPCHAVVACLHLVPDNDQVALHFVPCCAVVAVPLQLVLDDHPDLCFEHP